MSSPARTAPRNDCLPRLLAAPSFLLLAALFLLLAAPLTHAEMALNLQAPATAIAQDIHDLHTLIMWVCFGIFLVVFLPMAYALWRHRKSAGHEAAKFHDNMRLEVVWTIIPVLILIGMAYPATRTVLAMKNVGNADLTIKITGRQWKWEYEYLGENLRFLSTLATAREQIANTAPKSEHYLLEVDKPLVVPAGRKVRLVLTATDVIHAWGVPALGVKQDAIPGFVRETWFRAEAPGTYRGQCAELCGVDHAFMPIVVEVREPEQYAAWMREQKTALAAAAAGAAREFTLAELMKSGAAVYQAQCAACHQANGAGLPPAFPPLAASALVNGPKEAHVERVFHGKSGTAMQAFGPQLSDLDIAAVITYERHSWGNRAADLVQPAEIAAMRKSSK